MSTYDNPNDQLTGRLAPQSILRQRYLIGPVAGRGGMSAVYRAIDTQQANHSVAVKEMSQRFMSVEEREAAIGRFKQEYELLNKLSFPNLPRIYDFFNEGDKFYIVMDFIEGKTLFELLRQNGGRPLPVAQVIGYALQLCDVLSYLHNQQPQPVIFRDLKPTNVMIRPDGRLFLIDFGIARLFKEGQQQDTVLLGSPGYAPPEQHGSAQTSPRSDLYALGATLHCLLTGRDPFNHPQRFVFPPIRQFNPLVPAELDSLIQQMLAHDERYRPNSALEVKQALMSFRQRAADETSNLSPMMAQTPAMASAPTQYPLPPPPVQRNFDPANANLPPGYRPTVPMESPASPPVLAATQLARPAQPAFQPRSTPFAGAGLFNRNIWSGKFLVLFIAMLILTLVSAIVTFNISNPYGLNNPAGLDHAVETALAVIFIIVALAAIAFVKGTTPLALLFVSALAAVPAAFAFVVQTVNDIQNNADQPFLSPVTPIIQSQLYTYGLIAASVILLLWVLRKNQLVERLTLLVAFGIPLICMLLLQFTSPSDNVVSHHVYLLITLIVLIQGVLVAARIEQVKDRP